MIKRLSRPQAPRQSLPWTHWFVLSAGGVLALAGGINVLQFFDKSQVYELQDPLLGLSYQYLLPLFGLVKLFVACLCLFTNKRNLSMGLAAWLVINLIAYRVVLWTMGWPHPWVFVGGLVDMFNISPLMVDVILFQIALYLLAGSVILLFRPQKPAIGTVQSPNYFKVYCKDCGGKTAFDTQWVGQTIPCPHCGKSLQLAKPGII